MCKLLKRRNMRAAVGAFAVLLLAGQPRAGMAQAVTEDFNDTWANGGSGNLDGGTIPANWYSRSWDYWGYQATGGVGGSGALKYKTSNYTWGCVGWRHLLPVKVNSKVMVQADFAFKMGSGCTGTSGARAWLFLSGRNGNGYVMYLRRLSTTEDRIYVQTVTASTGAFASPPSSSGDIWDKNASVATRASGDQARGNTDESYYTYYMMLTPEAGSIRVDVWNNLAGGGSAAAPLVSWTDTTPLFSLPDLPYVGLTSAIAYYGSGYSYPFVDNVGIEIIPRGTVISIR